MYIQGHLDDIGHLPTHIAQYRLEFSASERFASAPTAPTASPVPAPGQTQAPDLTVVYSVRHSVNEDSPPPYSELVFQDLDEKKERF
jgi:hypothetical protein